MNEHGAHRYWKEIINSINDGRVITGSDGNVIVVNSALERLTGCAGAEILGRSSCSIFNSDLYEAARIEGKDKWCPLFDLGQTNTDAAS